MKVNAPSRILFIVSDDKNTIYPMSPVFYDRVTNTCHHIYSDGYPYEATGFSLNTAKIGEIVQVAIYANLTFSIDEIDNSSGVYYTPPESNDKGSNLNDTVYPIDGSE